VIGLAVSEAVLRERVRVRGRGDDVEWERRWSLYAEKTLPLWGFYRERGLLQTVDATASVDMVAKNIAATLAQIPKPR
jgi:adenylate kinase family enzyme